MSNIIIKVEGSAIDGSDTNWNVVCPKCEYELEFEGYFDSGEVCVCPKCKTDFFCTKVWIDEKTYIE